MRGGMRGCVFIPNFHKFTYMTKRRIIWYHPDLKAQATELRQNPTHSEKILWEKLKGKQMKGYDFHRQKPLDHYIVDFYCSELMLAIEIDGSVHLKDDIRLRDVLRQESIEDYGVKFLRFTNEEVMNNLKQVVEEIEGWIEKVEDGHTHL